MSAKADRSLPSSRSESGKIDHLPPAIREEINRRLRGWQPPAEILSWLNALPEVHRLLHEQQAGSPITEAGLNAWRNGRYIEWLHRRERIEETRLVTDFVLQLAGDSGSSWNEGTAAVAGGRILEFIESSSGDNIVELVNALSRLRDADAKLLRARVAEKQAALAQAKFQRETTDFIIQWSENERARKIVESRKKRTVKMDELVTLIFGEPPATKSHGYSL